MLFSVLPLLRVGQVNASTDADGWRYARSFGRGTVWRNSFQPQMFVRRRRHVRISGRKHGLWQWLRLADPSMRHGSHPG